MEQEDIQLIIRRLKDSDSEIQKRALMALKDVIVSTQGSVGRATIDLLDIKDELKSIIGDISEENKRYLYDILSVMCVLDEGIEALTYRLNGGATKLSEWSHQYVRKLVKCMVDITNNEENENEDKVDFSSLIGPVVEFLLSHNSEVEAIDFLVEVSCVKPINGSECEMCEFGKAIMSISENDGCEEVDKKVSKTIKRKETKMENFDILISLTDSDNRERILTYLHDLSMFYDLESVLLAISSYNPTRYLVTLLRYNRIEQAAMFVRGIKDIRMRKQCLFILARCGVWMDLNENKNENETEIVFSDEDILNNKHVGKYYSEVAESLEILPPKKLESMFKGLNKEKIDMAAIANSFVHFGFKRDPVYFPLDGDYHIKEEYLEQLVINKSISTIASVGLINAFDPASIMEFYGESVYTEIGAILAIALSSYKTKDPENIISLLANFTGSEDSKEVIAALTGIVVLYAGTNSQEVYDIVFPLLSSECNNVALFSIYVLGAVFTGDSAILSNCIDVYKEIKVESAFTNFAILGLALFFYRQENIDFDKINLKESLTEKYDEVLIESEKIVNNDSNKDVDNNSDNNSNINCNNDCNGDLTSLFNLLDKHCKILAFGFIFIGSGNTKITDKIFAEVFVGEIDSLLELLGIISACLVGVGDSVSVELLNRISTSSLLLDSPDLRNIIPLCISLLYASNPKAEIIDVLEKLINSGDSSVNSLIALGICGAGTCSSRILRILDNNLCSVYKDSRASAALILSQGLVNLGKGMCTLSPMCYNKNVILQKSIVSLISTFMIFLDKGLFKEYSFLLYLITGAISPKYIAGYEGIIRIGKPVDVVGIAGKPNRISGPIVHNLPVILNVNEQAETEDDVCTWYIEDILVKNN